MQILTAQLTDLAGIQRLYATLFSEMAALAPKAYQPARQSLEFLLSILQREDCDILVALQEDGTLLGFALLQQLQTPPYACLVAHRYAYLMDLIVRKESRKMGVGRALLSAAKQWAKDRRLDYLELNVLAQNPSARALYLQEGFEDAAVIMRCPL